MTKRDNSVLRMITSTLLLAGLWLALIPTPALSQDLQNLIVNGGFEEGFQSEFGVGYGWGAFSNGNASAGWNADTWDKVVVAGQQAQLIEIKQALERDRYAGIYQTISVVPGQQYKLTIKGLVRSTEGDIATSNYGYRLQYAIDDEGGTAWELISADKWQEIPWDEQPLAEPLDGNYRFDAFETTVTAKGDKLTLFIRGWKKWLDEGTGIFDLDEISLVGPAPAAAPGQVIPASNEAEPAVVDTTPSGSTEVSGEAPAIEQTQAITADSTNPDATSSMPVDNSTPAEDMAETNNSPQQTDDLGATNNSITDENTPPTIVEPQVEPSTQGNDSAQMPASTLPVSGQGHDDSFNYIMLSGVVLLLVLLGGAIVAAQRQRHSVD